MAGNMPTGPISAGNSFLGAVASGGGSQFTRYSSEYHLLAISSPADNKVRLYHFTSFNIYLPLAVRT
jgi:hypothetical protein